MYNSFFGFKERPFKLVPNPEYLFLSKTHEEALAHLTYAVSQGDGFVEIIGEVGTGKTTLCRAFLNDLDETVEAAYIFNPKLNGVQLLQAINDEFGINSAPDNAKELIDILNTFLMEQKAAGRKVLLLIDEAQNLSLEVLEQLRLLSNLETTRDKLLQIILVGQPELAAMLESHTLRQLGQRISLSCSLKPLDRCETGAYIQHRLKLASRGQGVPFDQPAIREVHTFSRGVPRLINIACDRALLFAFTRNRRQITGGIAREAIRELRNKRESAHFLTMKTGGYAFIAACLLLAVILYPKIPGPENAGSPNAAITTPHIAAQPDSKKNAAPPALPEAEKPREKPEPAIIEPAAAATAVAEPQPPPLQELQPQEFQAMLAGLDPHRSRQNAAKTVLDRWQVTPLAAGPLAAMEDDVMFFRLAAKQKGLSVRIMKTTLDQVLNLNLPAILAFYLPDQPPRYLAVTGAGNGMLQLRSGEENAFQISTATLEPFWTGIVFIPWKDFRGLTGIIPRTASTEAIINLKLLLHDLGFAGISLDPVYDDETRIAVRSIQEKYGLETDGVVGPSTKIALYNEKQELGHPRLTRKEATPTTGPLPLPPQPDNL